MLTPENLMLKKFKYVAIPAVSELLKRFTPHIQQNGTQDEDEWSTPLSNDSDKIRQLVHAQNDVIQQVNEQISQNQPTEDSDDLPLPETTGVSDRTD